MRDEDKSKGQLIAELTELRGCNPDMAASESERERTKEQLQTPEERFGSICQNHSSIILLIEPKGGRIVYANLAAEGFYGYAKSDLTKMAIQDINQLDADEVQLRRQQAAKGIVNAFTFPHKLCSGEIRQVQVHSSPVPHRGEPLLLSIIHDVTDRSRAEEALRASQGLLTSVTDNSPEHVMLLDSDGTIQFINRTVLDLLKEEVIGRSTYDFTPSAFHGAASDCFERVLRTGVADSYTTEYVCKTGETRHFEVRIGPVVTGTEVTGLVSSSRDVTERKRTEEAMRTLELAVEQSIDGIALADLGGNIQSANAAWAKMHGYDCGEDLQGKHLSVFHNEAQMQKDVVPFNQRVMQVGAAEGVVGHTRRDGTTFDSYMSTTLLKDEGGEKTGLIGIARDITELRRSEEERLELESQLQRAQKHEALGTLAGGIAHDFNNLLQGMLGNADLAMWNLAEDCETRRRLELVMAGGRRAVELVEQILAFSLKTQATRTPVRLQTVLAEALKLLRPALPSTIEIQQHVDGGLGLVLANPTQMHQVITNLATNAGHAMRDSDSGVLELRLEATTVDEAVMEKTGLSPGEYAQLTVSDTGHGIGEETLKHIFDPYFTTKDLGEGSGLGLATVYGIVNGHDGAVSVESEVGSGSKFAILLPLVDRKTTVLPGQLGLGFAPRGTERIMFIDDEAGLVELTKLGLERLGYEVEAHTSSIEALAAFRTAPQRYDVVVTDQTMPQMTGVHLAEQALSIRPDCSVILCSGHSEVVNEEQAKALGIAHYARKPLIVRDLARTIRTVLASREEVEPPHAAA